MWYEKGQHVDNSAVDKWEKLVFFYENFVGNIESVGEMFVSVNL